MFELTASCFIQTNVLNVKIIVTLEEVDCTLLSFTVKTWNETHKESRESLLSTYALRTLYFVIMSAIIALEISKKKKVMSQSHPSILLACNVLKLVILDGIYAGIQTC